MKQNEHTQGRRRSSCLRWVAAAGTLIVCQAAFGQGQVHFNNRVGGEVDARFMEPDGTGLGAGYRAQLYFGPPGTSLFELEPLLPFTTFRTNSPEAQGYVVPIDVIVPGFSPGSRVTLAVRAFLGESCETSPRCGFSSPITITLGGGTLPPSNLAGLQGWSFLSSPPTFLPPAILEGPKSQTIGAGGVAMFTVRFESFASLIGLGPPLVSGQPDPPVFVPPDFQWFFNGTAIEGANAAELVLNGVQLSQAGRYSVAITNPAGTVSSEPALLTVTQAGVTRLKGDFDGNANAGILFQDDDGFLGAWFMLESKLSNGALLTPNRIDPNYRIGATADFDKDGQEDLLFQHDDGTLAVWFMDGINLKSGSFLNPKQPGASDWRVVGAGHFDTDADVDILFQHSDGTLAVWLMDGTNLKSGELLNPSQPSDPHWRVAGVDDFDANGTADLVFQHRDGSLAVWHMNGTNLSTAVLLDPRHPGDAEWRVSGVADYNNDQKTDLLWQHADGSVAIWFMNGTTLSSAALTEPRFPRGTWRVAGPK